MIADGDADVVDLELGGPRGGPDVQDGLDSKHTSNYDWSYCTNTPKYIHPLADHPNWVCEIVVYIYIYIYIHIYIYIYIHAIRNRSYYVANM